MSAQWLLPIRCESRISLSEIRLTHIGQFGLPRKARMGIPAHLHTGIDIMRPNENYVNQPIFPASNGVVISIRDEGPFSQIIIEHTVKSFGKLWSVYEHVAGIRCSLGQKVEPSDTIARFFNRRELDKHGWQFDHYILKF